MRAPRLKRFVWYAAAATVLLGALVWHVAVDRQGVERFYPKSYSARVDELIRANLLTADCSGNEPRIYFHPSAASPFQKAWYEASFLKDDVRRFNRNHQDYGESFSVGPGCQLRAVNPGLHAIDLPFHVRHGWSGDVFWSGAAGEARLTSVQRTLGLREPGPDEVRQAPAKTAVGAPESVDDAAIQVGFESGGRGPRALLHSVRGAAGGLVVENGIPAGAGAVVVTGRRLPEGRAAMLHDGDWLTFASPPPGARSEIFLVNRSDERNLASTTVLRNARRERVVIKPEPELGVAPNAVPGQRRPLLEALVGSIGTLVAGAPPMVADAAGGTFDVDLSLDRQLQQTLDQSFGDFCADTVERQGLAHDFAGGVTVMDGKTGEVLALATFPNSQRLAKRAAGGAGATGGAGELHDLARNQNLVPHEIGSAGKPFLFAAIAQQYPFLMQMVMPAHSKKLYQEIFHCRLPQGFEDEPHVFEVDFRKALEASCNLYTVHLATLALAAARQVPAAAPLSQLVPPDPKVAWPTGPIENAVRVGGHEVRFPPDLRGYVLAEPLPAGIPATTAARQCEEMHLLNKAPFLVPFEEITGVATQVRPEDEFTAAASNRQLDLSNEASGYKVSVWGRLSESLIARYPEPQRERARAEVDAGLLEVAPEAVNLRFNEVSRLRDFVSVLLGGASSRWTNVQLAESLSRLVTGRWVQATLVRDVPPRLRPAGYERREPAPERLRISAEVRKAVLEGMERVVKGSNGTGRALEGAAKQLSTSLARQGRELKIYSKTGSPVIEHGIAGNLGPVLHNLVDHYLVYAADGIGFRPDFSAARYPAGARAFERALGLAVRKSNPKAHLESQVYRVVRRFYSHRAQLTWNGPGDPPARFDSPLFVAGGKLRFNPRSSLLQGRTTTYDGAIYILALVSLPLSKGDAGVPEPERLWSPDARVVTVALHLESGPTSKLAVRAAAKLLGDLEPFLR
jgi:hypothetical protein